MYIYIDIFNLYAYVCFVCVAYLYAIEQCKYSRSFQSLHCNTAEEYFCWTVRLPHESGWKVTSWWFQPNFKNISPNWIISPSRDEHKKYLSCHHVNGQFLHVKSALWNGMGICLEPHEPPEKKKLGIATMALYVKIHVYVEIPAQTFSLPC